MSSSTSGRRYWGTGGLQQSTTPTWTETTSPVKAAAALSPRRSTTRTWAWRPRRVHAHLADCAGCRAFESRRPAAPPRGAGDPGAGGPRPHSKDPRGDRRLPTPPRPLRCASRAWRAAGDRRGGADRARDARARARQRRRPPRPHGPPPRLVRRRARCRVPRRGLEAQPRPGLFPLAAALVACLFLTSIVDIANGRTAALGRALALDRAARPRAVLARRTLRGAGASGRGARPLGSGMRLHRGIAARALAGRGSSRRGSSCSSPRPPPRTPS